MGGGVEGAKSGEEGRGLGRAESFDFSDALLLLIHPREFSESF